jgi:putative oxidoreductase
MTAAGLLVLRLVVAVLLIAHGSHQVFALFTNSGLGPGGLTAAAARLTALGIEPAYPLAVMAGVIQLVTGGLIAVGVLTRSAAIAALFYFAAVIWKAQWRWGFFANWLVNPERGHGIEMSLMMVGALVCLTLTGAGDWSFDGRRARAAAARASGRARLRRN